MDTNSVQGGLDGLLGPRVKHLVSDRGSIRVPGDENQFGGWASIGGSEFQIYQSVTAIVIRHVFAEVLESSATFSMFLDVNSLLVNNLVDVVTVLESFGLDLETLEGCRNVVCANYTCGLQALKKKN